jgi:hypothetical protein
VEDKREKRDNGFSPSPFCSVDFAINKFRLREEKKYTMHHVAEKCNISLFTNF